MKTCFHVLIGAALAALLVGPSIAKAESGYFAPVVYGSTITDANADRIAALESEIAELRQQITNGGSAACGDCGGGCSICDDCWLGYRGCGGLTFRAEALLMAYHRSDGMRVGTDANEWVNSSFNLAPRLTLGYAGPEGTGIRLRWFDYNHNERSVADVPGEFISVDTFNLDVELFDEVRLNRNWALELSGGYRINNFTEIMVDGPVGENEIRSNIVNGQGAVFGVEARRDFCWGSLYGGLRGSILLGDHSRINDRTAVAGTDQIEGLGDVVTSIWEIGIGYEASWVMANGGLAYIRVGGEWQQWQNFSSNFDATAGPGTLDALFTGESDVGFGGFTFAIGFLQ